MTRESRAEVAEWIGQERARYADVKFAEDGANHQRLVESMRTEGLDLTWSNFILNYLKRAEMFGMDTQQGRQALGKAVVTCLHALETAIEVHGPMPEPGFSSGEIRPWAFPE